MRLFVAIEIADEVRRAVDALVGDLRRRVGDLAPQARVTWAAAERVHLTLVFIGECTEERAVAVAGVLAGPIEHPCFQIVVSHLGAFPERGAPRVLWAGIEDGRREAAALQTEVSRRLLPLGIEPEARPFRPHLTLGRVREPAGLRSQPLFAGLEDARLGTTTVEAITLFQSRLSPRGPAYVALQRTPLRQGSPNVKPGP